MKYTNRLRVKDEKGFRSRIGNVYCKERKVLEKKIMKNFENGIITKRNYNFTILFFKTFLILNCKFSL